MLNYVWALMILVGVLFGAFTGNMSEITKAAIDNAGEAMSLCFTMAGVVSMWMGLMEIVKDSGLMDKLAKGLSPFLFFFFPGIPRDHPALKYIATSIVCNVLGLGWACTPAGLKVMESLEQLEKERGNLGYVENEEGDRVASNEMCNYLILNISSLQLIPVNMIAYRAKYGSLNPAKVIAPAIIATGMSTLTAIVFCKVRDGLSKKR